MLMIEWCPPFQRRPSLTRWMNGRRFMWGYLGVTYVGFDFNQFLEVITKTAIAIADKEPNWRPAVEARRSFEQPKFMHLVSAANGILNRWYADEIEEAIKRYADCGVELARMGVEVRHGPYWCLTVDGVVRESWTFRFESP